MPTYDELKQELKEIAKVLGEFPDSLRPQVYELLIVEFAGPTAIAQATKDKKRDEAAISASPTPSAKPKKDKSGTIRKGSLKESYSVDRNLNLRGGKNVPSFSDFYMEKQPRSAQEFNAVAVYYLKKVLDLETATLDQVYTCYREVKRPQPKAFKQSFIDTKNKGGWIEFDTNGNLEIPHRGAVFVEHDLPHAKSTNAERS